MARGGAWDVVLRRRRVRRRPAHPLRRRGRRGAAGGLADWSGTPEGALARVLLLDQLPRNLHRGSALAFATDPQARAVAEAAIRRGFDQAIEPELRPFVYMPLEHAEDAATQARAVALFARYAQAGFDRRAWMRYALIHQRVIHRFGRFPHRNAVLGRTTTPEEAVFLAAGGFSG